MRTSTPLAPAVVDRRLLLAAAVALATAALAAAPATAAAQMDAAVGIPSGGDWVRVHTIPGTVFTGRLTPATSADTLWVATPPRRALRGMSAQSTWRTFPIATTNVRLLERGHDRGQGWVIGGTVLGGALGLAGAVAMAGAHSSGESSNTGGLSAVLVVGGAATGLFLANATRLHFSPVRAPHAAAAAAR